MRLTKIQILLLTFFIGTVVFLLLGILFIVIAGNHLHHVLETNPTSYILSGINGYNNETNLTDFPSAFALFSYGLNFIFSMHILDKSNDQIVATSYFIELYQTGYLFLIVIIPVFGAAFIISTVYWMLLPKPKIRTEVIKKVDNNKLIDDLKNNMNQIQDYLIKLNNDVKTLKKFTGLITPSTPPAKPVMHEQQVNQLNNNNNLDAIHQKIQNTPKPPTEMLKTVDRDEFERTNHGIERPKTLVTPNEYIMPKRDKVFVENFPTQQFLSSNLPKPEKSEKKLSLSAIFDRKKIKSALANEEDKEVLQGRVNKEAFQSFPLEFNDPTVIEDADFREKVGFNLNNYDYLENDEIKPVKLTTVYQPGDVIFENGIEYEILLAVPRQFSDLTMYELTLKSKKDGTIKSIMKK